MNNKIRFSKRTGRDLLRTSMMVAVFISADQVLAQQVEKSSYAGNGIYEAVINDKDGHIYVTGAGSRTQPGGAIYKIDPVDLSIVDSIPLTENPPFGLGLNHKTQIAYTSNTRTNSVSAVDLKTGKLIAVINSGAEKSHTREVLVDEKKNLIYVTDVNKRGSIWVIEGKTNTFSHLIPEVGNTTTGLTFGESTNFIYASNIGDDMISKIDVKAKKVVKSFPSGGESPINIASDGKRLFVTNQKSGTLTVLDLDGKLIKSIPTGDGAIGIAYDPVKNRLYSANRQTGTTTIIDADSYEVIADLKTGSHPNNVKVDAKTGTAYVLNKAKGGRPVEGQPIVVDTEGNTISKIN